MNAKPHHKVIFGSLLCCVLVLPVNAQTNPWSVSAGSGVSFYLGDLSYRPLSSTELMHPFAYVSLNYQMNAVFGTHLGFFLGKVSGADSLAGNKGQRDFHFKSNITDFHFLLDVDLPAAWRGLRRKSGLTKRLDHLPLIAGPKLIGGVGYFHFNPKAYYAGEWYALQPLGTEGQQTDLNYPDPYRLWQLNIKAGGEIGFHLNRRWRIDLFMHYTILFTDYLDDVGGYYPEYSDLAAMPNGELLTEFAYRRKDNALPKSGNPRGNPQSNDRYMSVGLKLNYTIGKGDLRQLRL
jgi:hypothetical protein